MTIDIKHLESLLERVTPGEWYEQSGELETSRVVRNKDGVALAVVHSYGNGYGPGRPDRDANAELMAMSKSLARRVIAAEKLAEALREMMEVDERGDDLVGYVAETAKMALSEWGSLDA